MGRHRTFDQEKAVDQALALFWAKGYEGTSIQDLCTHLGIHRGSLYDTFGDKQELFIACMDRFREMMADDLHAILKEEPEAPKEQLERFFVKLIDMSMDNAAQRRGCFMADTTVGNAIAEPQVASRVEAHALDTETLFFRFLMRAQRGGGLKSKHTPRELARFLVGAKQGIQVMAKTAPDRSVLEDVSKVTLSMLFG